MFFDFNHLFLVCKISIIVGQAIRLIQMSRLHFASFDTLWLTVIHAHPIQTATAAVRLSLWTRRGRRCCYVAVDVSACKPSCINWLLDRVNNCAHCVMLWLSSGQRVSWNNAKRYRPQCVYAWDSYASCLSDILFDLRSQARQWPPGLRCC